jgi:uncharacterized membrane protein
MINIEESIIIHRPIEEVFTYMTDLRNAPEWQSGLLEVQQTTEGPVGIGTTYLAVRRFLGRKMESTMEIIGYEPNSSLKWKTVSSPMPFTTAWHFKLTAEGAQVIWTLEAEVGLFGLADRFVANSIRRDAVAGFGTLKDMLENQVIAAA